MIRKISKLLISTFALLGVSLFCFAQENISSTKTEMADALRADGKIYVVVLVVMIVFTFFSMYLLLTDRHVKKLEKELEEIKNSKK